MVTVAIVGATTTSRHGLGLVHLWLVRIIIDIVLTLRRTRKRLKKHTIEENQSSFKTKSFTGVSLLVHRKQGLKPKRQVITVGRWMIELLEVTVCSPSCIMAISLLLSSEASARLLTELL